MIEGARILEADSYGPKVYLLQDGNILKLFRRKRLFHPPCFGPIRGASSTTPRAWNNSAFPRCRFWTSTAWNNPA
ncbi:Oligosaccharide repeat unit polymerase Wzy [Pseudomonas chlororaphis subsp. aurantiaca]|uniref:Oligosaccharide repeat unit polymerase Wzy n=1 Tax=Pseudomonas chlororaphis subsp. aureofaciens TaxID=587851 RepID=A0AAD1E554_9PSED|nr:Oligosaccharide repeat unit polymerase Wzy [Pseudomonas chlororaphis subsp. aurantiaca]AZE20980.1 Oligosaccharide repeat unit polymerase Wzy [Pseudomonas chlororaphis subsp. aureofaciens]AZE27334.1 Oligosaccharide repeat unit polymerase Wzy [Pseudomonas chlororaphis subsp. aureofaciens]